MLRVYIVAVLALGCALTAGAQPPPGFNGVYIRVVDNGAGLCTITVTPDGHAMIYDTGHWNQGFVCVDAA